MVPAKNGSDRTRSSGSGTTSATESVRRVTSERAARFGVKPSSATAAPTDARASGETRSPPLIAREAVERETPARSATCSSVGAANRARGGWARSISSLSVVIDPLYCVAARPPSCSRSGTALPRATAAYQSALAFGVRTWVS